MSALSSIVNTARLINFSPGDSENEKNPPSPAPSGGTAQDSIPSIQGAIHGALNLVEGTVIENLRALRQAIRSWDGVRVAWNFPANGPAPTQAQLSSLGTSPGPFFGVALPLMAWYATSKRSAKISKNPAATESEKITVKLAKIDAGLFAGFSIVNFAANQMASDPHKRRGLFSLLYRLLGHASQSREFWKQLASKTGLAVPFIGTGYSFLSGISHYLSGKNHGFISEGSNRLLSGGEMGAGLVSLGGFWMFRLQSAAATSSSAAATTSTVASVGRPAVATTRAASILEVSAAEAVGARGSSLSRALLRSRWGAAFVVATGAVLTVGCALLHDAKSSEGVGEQLAEELSKDQPSPAAIQAILKKSHPPEYDLFNGDSVVALLENLKQSSKVDRLRPDDPLVKDLRKACYEALVKRFHFGQTKAEQRMLAAALLFFADDENLQDTLQFYFEKASSYPEVTWRLFAQNHGITPQNFGEFLWSRISPERKHKMLADLQTGFSQLIDVALQSYQKFVK